MLEMRTQCEKCNTNLPPESEKAWICSYECTWCSSCNATEFKGKCPNCGGSLQPRPSRIKK